MDPHGVPLLVALIVSVEAIIIQGHDDQKGVTTTACAKAIAVAHHEVKGLKNASFALWYFVDIMTCCYKCRTTSITRERQRSLRESLNKFMILS